MENSSLMRKPITIPHPDNPRPQSERESPFRRLPAVPDNRNIIDNRNCVDNRKIIDNRNCVDNRNCIWITQDILNEFKAHVARSHTVTLKFNNVDEKAKELEAGRPRFPPLFANRVRMIHNRSSSNFELKETKSYRPVKVYVDDIARTHGVGNGLPEVHCRLHDKHRKLPGAVSKTHNGSGQSKRHNIDNKNSDISFTRSMDSGEDGGEFPDDVIETVAKANTANTEFSAHILPEIRAAPCPIHVKRDKPKGQESIYATNSSVSGKTPRRLQTHPVTNITVQQNNPCPGETDKPRVHRKGNKLDINVKIPNQFPTTQAPLPKNMSSKDYVMTWLIHGSAPQGSNHFPDIIPNNHVKTKTKKTPRRSDLSE